MSYKKEQSLLTSINLTDDENKDFEEQNSIYFMACEELLLII